MLMISRVRGLFQDEPVALYLSYDREIIGQTSTQEENHNIPVQLMMCAAAKKLIADSTVQHDKLTSCVPYVNLDTNQEIKQELHRFQTHGQLSLLQPWLTTVILPKLNSIIPTSTYDARIARSMRKKYAQIEAIANYKGEFSAPIVAQESLTGV
jgi:hypothetical protein